MFCETDNILQNVLHIHIDFGSAGSRFLTLQVALRSPPNFGTPDLLRTLTFRSPSLNCTSDLLLGITFLLENHLQVSFPSNFGTPYHPLLHFPLQTLTHIVCFSARLDRCGCKRLLPSPPHFLASVGFFTLNPKPLHESTTP